MDAFRQRRLFVATRATVVVVHAAAVRIDEWR